MGAKTGNSDQAQVTQAALSWHAATLRDDCDWDAFTSWLEQDVTHQQAYHDVALLEERIARHRTQLQRSVWQAAQPASGRRRLYFAAAAVLVLGIGLAVGWRLSPYGLPPEANYQSNSTASPVLLKDGTQIVLMPHSHLSVGGRHQERLELQGGAYFDVPHDPNRTMTVRAGDYVVRDIGTRFELFGSGQLLKLAVAEGSVAVDFPGRENAAPVTAGQQLLIAGSPPVAEYASIAAGSVGTWHSGQLEFRNEPLRLVAEQVALLANVKVIVESSIADRRFSGVLAAGDPSQLVARLAEIMGLRVRQMGNVVHLSAVGATQ